MAEPKKPKLVRITTVPISLDHLLTGQPSFMKKAGFDVLLVSADGPEISKVVVREGCPHRIVPMTRAITPLADLQSLWQLFRLFRAEKPEIVHSHTPKAGLLGMWAARLAGVPIRLHTVAGLPLETAKGSKKRLLKFIEKLTYAAATEVWVNSGSLLAFVREQLSDAPKIRMIGEGSSNGIDLNRFSEKSLDPARLAAVDQQIGFEKGATRLLAIGRMVRDKGLPELLDAFFQLEKARPELRLVLVGPLESVRSEETLPADLVEKMATHPKIRHIGWSDEVEYFMAACQLLVHPSHREGFPNVVLQAGAMRLPIVCSAINGNIDIVENEKTGLHFSVGSASDLAEKLEKALAQPEKMRSMADALRQKIELFFARPRLHELLLAEYRRLLNQKN